MSVRSGVGFLLFLSALTLFASHCGSSSSSESSGDGGASTVDGRSTVDGSSTGDVGPATVEPGCGVRAGMRGKTSRTLMVDGTARTYIAYLPLSVSAPTAVPLVFVFHGAGMTAAEMYDLTQYAALADSEGIAVAFLDGQGASSSTGATAFNPWNVSDNGAAVCGAGNFVNNPTAGVDFAFMDAIKADVAQDQCFDTQHVFATGFSMGGYFTHHVGCDRTDIRAVAPHSGATLASLSSCKTEHVPIIIFHGAADTLIVPGCDDPNSTAVSGFPPSATLWAQKNGCKPTYTTVVENGSGGGDGQCYLYDGCPADGQVELCTFTGMAHCWAGGDTTGLGARFACATYTGATQLEWNFFKKYAW